MSEPIIIETPQPPVRERLMCVPEGTVVGGDAEVRDATPEDLERAGFVSFAKSNAHAERERADAMLFASRNAIDEYRREGESRSDAIHRLARERVDARAQAATLAAVVADAGLALAQAGIVSGGGLAEQVVRLVRERDEVRLILDASAGETTADAATRLHNDWVDARERADRVERERAVDALSERARLAAAERVGELGAALGERARCVAWLRAEAERIRSVVGLFPREGGWTPDTAAAVASYLDLVADRLERGEHAGAPVPAVDRATDEELVDVYQAGCESAAHGERLDVAGLRAVAARVRREQCLVEVPRG